MRRSHPPSARPDGFTLIEMMVTVIVLGVVVALAAPSFTESVRRNRMVTAANELSAALQTARMEAIRRNARVELCPTTDGGSCGGSDWSRLAIIATKSGETEVVRDVQLARGVVILASSNVAAGDSIVFPPSGFARIGTSNALSGSLSACMADMRDTNNTIDVEVSAGRIGTSRREGGETCTANTD